MRLVYLRIISLIARSQLNWILLYHGVLQGSILGPWFFSIFINDFSFASNLHSKLFADDTTL